jgi:hypothetical protein
VRLLTPRETRREIVLWKRGSLTGQPLFADCVFGFLASSRSPWTVTPQPPLLDLSCLSHPPLGICALPMVNLSVCPLPLGQEVKLEKPSTSTKHFGQRCMWKGPNDNELDIRHWSTSRSIMSRRTRERLMQPGCQCNSGCSNQPLSWMKVRRTAPQVIISNDVFDAMAWGYTSNTGKTNDRICKSKYSQRRGSLYSSSIPPISCFEYQPRYSQQHWTSRLGGGYDKLKYPECHISSTFLDKNQDLIDN